METARTLARWLRAARHNGKVAQVRPWYGAGAAARALRAGDGVGGSYRAEPYTCATLRCVLSVATAWGRYMGAGDSGARWRLCGCVSWSFGMVVDMSETLTDAIRKLARFAYVLDRATEREPRTITLTDDEAVALLARLDEGRTDA